MIFNRCHFTGWLYCFQVKWNSKNGNICYINHKTFYLLLNKMLSFQTLCSIRSMFRVLGIYNFACRLVHPWEKNMHLKLHFLAKVKCKEMHLGICVSRLKSLKSSQRYRILVERGAITPYLIKVAVLWTKTVVSLSVIVLGQKFKQIAKLIIHSK